MLTLQNGTIIEWESENCFENPNIRIVSKSSESTCGNPWNQMSSEEERQFVLSTRPKTSLKPEMINGFLQTKFLNLDQTIFEMQAIIYADFSCLYATDEKRSFIENIYDYDQHEDEFRTNLHDNCKIGLIETYLNQNQTLIFIMGGGHFQDAYFQRHGDVFIMNEWVYLK
jgi:hypothetical protein